MRFSAAIQPSLPLRTPAAAEFLRRLVAGKSEEAQSVSSRPEAPARADELPADLDQRVRLLGEW
ncbi:MAG TPA: hypothetical protein VK981_04675 [Ramlibacter sp.]|nr:hypothetical protein [Ramlibacter sp.]